MFPVPVSSSHFPLHHGPSDKLVCRCVFRLYTYPRPLNAHSVNASKYMQKHKYALVHHLTFATRTPGSKALTLAVQHVAAAGEKEQEKKRRTPPAPTPGRPRPRSHHHPLPAPYCRFLHRTLRGVPLWAANSRSHHANRARVRVRLCALLLQLSLSAEVRAKVPSSGSSPLSLPTRFPALTPQLRRPKLAGKGGGGGQKDFPSLVCCLHGVTAR